MIERDNVNVHRAAAKIIVSKSRAARGSVCNVLLSRVSEIVPIECHGVVTLAGLLFKSIQNVSFVFPIYGAA